MYRVYDFPFFSITYEFTIDMWVIDENVLESACVEKG